MVRESVRRILDDGKLCSNEEIMNIKLTELHLNRIFSNAASQNSFLSKIGIIKKKFLCPKCNDGTYLCYKKRKQAPDGYHWTCIRKCRFSYSIRYNSIFQNSRLPMRTIFFIFYKYINGISLLDIARELEISRNTVSEYVDLVREIICEHIASSSEKLGGLNIDGTKKVVEIDESLFFKRKYNRGCINDGQWFVGGVERGSKKTFIVPVENRNAETLGEVIFENVLPNTIVITDQWRAYHKALENMVEYEHRSVNHSINFVNPEDKSIHTQAIEGLWSLSKRFLREKPGISKEQHLEYLIQFIWQQKIEKSKCFNTLLTLL
ncbi:hypothetical protein DMUE_4915 [Dictyocoela muelleri]|nr:hypothetical protein DMUE_4915 [Dictyocoela muelleri]